MTLRELVQMNAAREEAEWWRLSYLMAFIANCLRFSRDTPIVHPKDVNPLLSQKGPAPAPRSAKDQMNRFFAQHPEMPIQRLKCVDGNWETVADEPVFVKAVSDGS